MPIKESASNFEFKSTPVVDVMLRSGMEMDLEKYLTSTHLKEGLTKEGGKQSN